MMTDHRGGFGIGPGHIVSCTALAATPAPGQKQCTTGAVAGNAPAHVKPPNVRRTELGTKTWCPVWIQKMVHDDATLEEVVLAAVKRVKRHGSEETLVEVETLFNELTRQPEHARRVRAALNCEVIADVLRKGAVS